MQRSLMAIGIWRKHHDQAEKTSTINGPINTKYRSNLVKVMNVDGNEKNLMSLYETN